MKILLSAYGVALSGYPFWAIANAARKFMRGEIPDQSMIFCPRPPELATAVRRELEPIYRRIDRERRQLKIAQENAEFRPTVRRTPERMQSAIEAYRQYCKTHAAAKRSPDNAEWIRLDPALVEQIDDAPTTFERLKWIERGGNDGRP